MCLITTLKDTLNHPKTPSGKVYQCLTYDLAPHLARGRPDNPGDFCDYIHRLSDEEWLQFEADERAFRKILDTKLI